MYLNFSKWALFYLRGKISEQSLGPVKYPKFPRKREMKRFEGQTPACCVQCQTVSTHRKSSRNPTKDKSKVSYRVILLLKSKDKYIDIFP